MPPPFIFRPGVSTTAVIRPILSRFGGFNAHHAALKGEPGQRISDLEFVHLKLALD